MEGKGLHSKRRGKRSFTGVCLDHLDHTPKKDPQPVTGEQHTLVQVDPKNTEFAWTRPGPSLDHSLARELLGSEPGDAFEGDIERLNHKVVPSPDPFPRIPKLLNDVHEIRAIVAGWPMFARQKWGDLGNEIAESGTPWPDDEIASYHIVLHENPTLSEIVPRRPDHFRDNPKLVPAWVDDPSLTICSADYRP